jgi:hypothetical protein
MFIVAIEYPGRIGQRRPEVVEYSYKAHEPGGDVLEEGAG